MIFLNTLLSEISRCNNIFDFLIYIYGSISVSELDSIRECKSCKSDQIYMDLYKEIIASVKVFNKNCFSEWRDIWIKLINKKPDCINAFCIDTLLCFDNLYFSNRNTVTGKKIVTNCGPLNNYTSQDFLFFLSPPKTLINDSMTKKRIIRGRKTLIPNPAGLILNNYMIIRKDSLSGYIPKVNQYNFSRNISSFESESLNSVIVPFFCEKWFTYDINTSTNEFSIISKSDNNQIINKAILNIIIDSDRNGQNIIVFPEMSMNSDTLIYIKEHLLNIQLKNIKLIFLGSYWSCNTNTSYIISKNGTELLSYIKKQPFDFYNKETKLTFRESLKSTHKSIDFLDIEGIGRISYLICRDYTDVAIDYISTDVMQSFLSVVSSCGAAAAGRTRRNNAVKKEKSS